jgi:hypothetical protein
MSQRHSGLRDWMARCLRLSAFGVAGTAVLAYGVALPSGAAYAWLMTGYSPVTQLREAGLVVLVSWPVLGVVFGWLHVAGTFMLEPQGPWGMAGVTVCLAVLWGIAMRRGRAYRHTVLKGHEAESAGGRTRG